MGSQFVRQWRAFFLRLERLHNLNHQNPAHIWLIHFLFLDEINADADAFCEDWNHHPLSGKGINNQSPHVSLCICFSRVTPHDSSLVLYPKDLFFLGQTAEGLDVTEFEDVPTELLQQYYGVQGPHRYRLPTETGAGHPVDEQVVPDSGEDAPMEIDDEEEEETDDEELEPLEQLVADSIQKNIRHAPVKVRRHRCPFNAEQVQAYGELLAEVLLSPLRPLNTFSWATTESIPLGRRKELRIDLGGDMWKSRARKWDLAVEVFTRLTQ